MTASLRVAAHRSIFWPQVGEIGAVLVGLAFATRPWIGVATIRLATNFAQSALSLTPIDPRITIGLWSVAWRAAFAWRRFFRRTCSFAKELGTMKEFSLFVAVLAAIGVIPLFCGVVSAHPGVDGVVVDCHVDEDSENGDDCEDATDRGLTAVADDQEDDDSGAS